MILLALDFGGTKHAAAIAVAGETQWQAYQRVLAPANSNREMDLEVMRSLIKTVLMRQTACETVLPEVQFEIVPTALGNDAPHREAIVLAEESLTAATAKPQIKPDKFYRVCLTCVCRL